MRLIVYPALVALAACAGERIPAGVGAGGGGQGVGEDDEGAVSERGTVDGCVPSNRGIEICDGADNDCDGKIDDELDLRAIGAIGGPCGEPVGECTGGTTACVEGETLCVTDADPVDESCDGLDNDCDGETDEAEDLRILEVTGDRCGEAEGECRRGIVRCRGGALICDGAVDPAPEECNLFDDDCDGETDELEDLEADGIAGAPCGSDVGACAAGTLVCEEGRILCMDEVMPSDEVCDGVDNDCDGGTDEFDDLALAGLAGGRCGLNEGRCTYGVAVCEAGVIVCDGAVDPQNERCNAEDDDCDGATDEAFDTLGDRCGTGACHGGRVVCDEADPDGQATRCSTADQASLEACDGIDNDCDGDADEADDLLELGVVGAVCGSREGECSEGVSDCLRGGSLVCVDEVPPGNEACNGLDDDCDGEADEGVPQCRDGEYFCDPAEASDEECDGLDNDCDGDFDEADPELGQACVRQNDGCRRPGVRTCVGGALICGPGDEDAECLPVDEEIEPNNTGNSCNAVSTGGHRVEGVISRAGDRDWYCFDARAGQTVEFDVDARVAGSSLDSYLYLWKLSPRDELARNDDFAGSLDSFIRWTFDSDGRYAIEVGSWMDRGCAECSYTLIIR